MYLCICCEGRAISKKPKLGGVSTEHSNYHRPIKPAASIQIPKYSQWIDLEELIPGTFSLLFVYLALCISCDFNGRTFSVRHVYGLKLCYLYG